MNTIELIHTMAKRPGMYVDMTSMDSIHAFIQGFYFCRSLEGLLDEQDRHFADHFHPWLKKTHRLEDAADWGHLLSALTRQSALQPWEVFIQEFQRFIQNKA